MNVAPGSLDGLLLVEIDVHRDARGSFAESWRAERYRACGVAASFVQDNIVHSRRHVLRGLHLQMPHQQDKLVTVLAGEIFDVAVDLRVGSPSFGRWAGYELSAVNGRQLYVPGWFAHGYLVTSETAVVSYKCSAYYDPSGELALAWDDPDVAIRWPLATPPVLSPKDAAASRLADLPRDRLPRRPSTP